MPNGKYEKKFLEIAQESRRFFYDSLASALESNNLTRNRFLKETGITTDSYRRGKREKEPGLDTVVMIANYFGLSIDSMCHRSTYALDTANLKMDEAIRLFLLLADALNLDISKTKSYNILFDKFISDYIQKQESADKAVQDGWMTPDEADAKSRTILNSKIEELADIPTGAEYRDIVSSYAKRMLRGEMIKSQAVKDDDDDTEYEYVDESPKIISAADELYSYLKKKLHGYPNSESSINEIINSYFTNGPDTLASRFENGQ